MWILSSPNIADFMTRERSAAVMDFDLKIIPQPRKAFRPNQQTEWRSCWDVRQQKRICDSMPVRFVRRVHPHDTRSIASQRAFTSGVKVAVTLDYDVRNVDGVSEAKG